MDDDRSDGQGHSEEPDTLRGRAAAAADATWGMGQDGSPPGVRVPGALMGDIGSKGRIAAQHRELSRRERGTYGDVAPGTVTPGSGRYLLVMIACAVLLLLAAAALLAWVVS